MNQPTDRPAAKPGICFIANCQEHPSWLRPVTERRSYPAGRGRVAA